MAFTQSGKGWGNRYQIVSSIAVNSLCPPPQCEQPHLGLTAALKKQGPYWLWPFLLFQMIKLPVIPVKYQIIPHSLQNDIISYQSLINRMVNVRALLFFHPYPFSEMFNFSRKWPINIKSLFYQIAAYQWVIIVFDFIDLSETGLKSTDMATKASVESTWGGGRAAILFMALEH